MRIDDALGDRLGVNVAIIDVPAVLPVFGPAVPVVNSIVLAVG
jgi:hypothetical protein